MKNVLTRKQLINAKNVFNCIDWENLIQEILDSTNEEKIEIEDKYLDLIKQKATWDQILFCKALNLDLKWSIPQETKAFVLEKIKVCEVIKYNEFETFYKENGKTLFELDSKYKFFYFDYHKIHEVLEDKYSLKDNEINELMSNILEGHFKIEDYRIL